MLHLLPYWPQAADEASHRDRQVRWSPWVLVPGIETHHVVHHIVMHSRDRELRAGVQYRIILAKSTYLEPHEPYLCFKDATVEAVAFLVIVQTEFQRAQRG